MTCDINASRQALYMIIKSSGRSKGTNANACRWISKYKTKYQCSGPTAATLTDKKHGVGPHNEVWEVQPLYDVVIEVGTLESPWVICREGGGEEQNQ